MCSVPFSEVEMKVLCGLWVVKDILCNNHHHLCLLYFSIFLQSFKVCKFWSHTLRLDSHCIFNEHQNCHSSYCVGVVECVYMSLKFVFFVRKSRCQWEVIRDCVPVLKPHKWLKSFQEKITMCSPRYWHLSVGFTSACNSNGPGQNMIWDSQTAMLLEAYIAGCAVLIGEMILNFSQLLQVKLFLCVIKYWNH